MKLKFELKKQQIEYLYRNPLPIFKLLCFIGILSLVHQIWGSSEKCYFYFDQDCMIIYP